MSRLTDWEPTEAERAEALLSTRSLVLLHSQGCSTSTTLSTSYKDGFPPRLQVSLHYAREQSQHG